MAIAGGVDWENVATPLEPLSAVYIMIFYGFIAFVMFAMLNVVNAIFIQLAAASPATVPAQQAGWRLFEGARTAVTSGTSYFQVRDSRDEDDKEYEDDGDHEEEQEEEDQDFEEKEENEGRHMCLLVFTI
eukprot:8913080-Pyramimonas_sp.AAC.1